MSARSITKQDCYGCRDNFYNGNNGLGVQECWHFKDAKMEKRIVIHRDQRPPYKCKPELKPTCWYEENGLRAIKPESLTADGCWKW